MAYKYHNFKKVASGNYSIYRAKSGHDSNPGTDPNEPKKSFGTGIVGAGVYTNGSSGYIQADGKVIVRSPDGNRLSIYATIVTGVDYEVGNIQYVSQPSTYNECSFTDVTGEGASYNRYRDFNDCLFRNCPNGIVNTITSAQHRYYSCIFIDSLAIVAGNGAYYGQLRDSYINRGGKVILNSAVSGASVDILQATLRNCCCEGLIEIDGVNYELKRKKDGTPTQGTDPAIPDLATAPLYVNLAVDPYAIGNFNENPKFNDVAGGDYTLQADSPLIRAALGGIGNIGGKRAKIATSIINTDEGNEAGVRVMASPAISTIVPSAYILNGGYTEGYVDYLVPIGGQVINNLDLKALFAFDADATGGQPRNKNVPDAEPVTAEYPNYVVSTVANTALNLVTVPTGKIAVGQHVRVLGQSRLVTAKTTSGANDVLTVDRNFVAAVGAGQEVVFGTSAQLAATTPNRLTVFMRTKTTPGRPSVPMLDSEWDNGLDDVYGKRGYMFNQEIAAQPVLYIDGMNVYGGGDSDAPVGLTPTTMAPEHIHIRVFLRNNYGNRGVQA